MISFEHRAVFIHLKRTGGNSIEAALGGLVLLDANGGRTTQWDNQLHRGSGKNKIERRGTEIHATAMETRNLYPKEFESFFKFSVVRNPFAQVFSLYRRMRPKEDPNPEKFEAYLRTVVQKARIVPHMALCDEGGSNLMDEIIKFECLAEEFEGVARKIGLAATALPSFNASYAADYREFYTLAARRWVEDVYGSDIRDYGYTF